MTETDQRAKLQSTIWRIADDVRGTVDGWDFKQYILGILFYRFISENFTKYIEGPKRRYDYPTFDESLITPELIRMATTQKGFFIYPHQLFCNVVATAGTNPDLNTDLRQIFDAIEASAIGYESEGDIKGLFADFDTTSSRLGNTVAEKNKRLTAILKGIDSLDFGDFEQHQIDLFGDAYEFLISNYAANAGKSGGEFFTPQCVSALLARIALDGKTSVNKVYDPACGSGSLLLQAKKQFGDQMVQDRFIGQEINQTTYNLARMNMFLHDVNYDKFDIALGDTLLDPKYGEERPFDAIVSNPPYSIKWIGSDDPTLINDERFAPAGVLAPKSKADFAFVLHSLYHLSARGRAAIVCFPGLFYRGGAERKIRQYLVRENVIETIIALPPNLFFGTSIATNILVLSKSKPDTRIQFIDASGEEFFTKETNQNVLSSAQITHIVEIFRQKEEIPHIASMVDSRVIAESDFNLSVTSYVEPEDTREVIDIDQLNSDLRQTVERITRLRSEIDDIISKLEA